MDLYNVSKLKKLNRGDEIYVKYLELPADGNSRRYEGTCEVVCNNDEILTTNKDSVTFCYGKTNSDLAVIMNGEISVQIYKV